MKNYTVEKIFINFNLGSDILESIKQAKKIAVKYNCKVEFDFNGVTITVGKDSNIKESLIMYEYTLGIN